MAVDHQGERLPPSIVCPPPPHQPYVIVALLVNGDGWCLRSYIGMRKLADWVYDGASEMLRRHLVEMRGGARHF
eukprot:COSAG01_NODE_10246_length_2210_cov_29.623401_1_plen_73_part_10